MTEDTSERATSILASGPAGSHFEGQIGAFYLLSMLSGAPPRGLPGTTIERVALQQANAGRPLDDVIVHAHDLSGNEAVLEIQVKRAITFAPSDLVFRKVVGQIVKASQREDFLTIRYELAIATSKGSRRIDGAYQDVLMLARQIGDAATFMAQIKLEGVGNSDMRTFVQTFRRHLRDEGSPDDVITTWQLLRRLLILTFDFTATGSATEELARERAAYVLHGDDVSRAGALWGNLVDQAICVAKSGGDRTYETLLQSLAPLGFRFAGDRRHATARAALAEASRLALADIRNQIGNVVLIRQERIAAVYDALDRGRYVEVRGDTGVGKSGVLRQLAEQISGEGQVIVLSPGRCIPRGWQAMRAQLRFDGSARNLLVELANDGGAILFIDNLDLFNDEERLTVIDLVRTVATIPGISVIVTARHEFGIDEPSWLPADALDQLGRTAPIEINGLSKTEIEQLKIGDPTLAPLLADSHPAHQITRSLFRLDRLVRQAATEPLPRTEVDMAEQWWKTADGSDRGRRDRSRLLQYLAEKTFLQMISLDVKDRAAEPIDALIASGTLRNLGIDQVAFRHDVFRDWAVANVLHADTSWINRLNLERPPPAILARGIELAARIAIERAVDGKAWHSLVERLSRPGAHQSWRRAALLALVRSEADATVLTRALPELQENYATLLRELIRIVLAVEVIPASTVFSAAGVDSALIPKNLNIPRGPVCLKLIFWLLSLEEKVPAAAIPEIVELYTTFSIGTLGVSAITPLTTRCLYGWLRLMEPRDLTLPPSNGKMLWEGIQREQFQSLKLDLRSGFAMFSKATPELAAEYLNAVARIEHNYDLVRSILKMRGTLAQAAPAELANLTAQALIEKPRPRDRYCGHEREEPFTFLDSEFLPTSPAQGPFFELLVSSPEDGLALVHRLVDHAITHGSRGRSPGANAIILALPGAERSFPWTQTYFWSRNSNNYCVTSALMALEAWGHRRLDAGEAFGAVLADVLGPVGSAAAYLLVAVDLIISHWSKSVEVATEFLGCPELLCFDHTRQTYDRPEISGSFELSDLRTEPRGAVSTAELKKRASRQTTLDGLIGNYALMVSPKQLGKLVALLHDAAVRLGPPCAEANLGDPEFMVVHALNLAEPANWPEVEVTQKDGSTTIARHYEPPVVEQQHFQALQEAAAESTFDFEMQSAISLATDNPSYLSNETRSTAIVWARRAAILSGSEPDDSDDSTSQDVRKMAILTVAMIAIRDGDVSLRGEHEEWARGQLKEVFHTQDNDPVHQMRVGLHYNPAAIAFVGLIHALRHRNTLDDVRVLLEIAAHDNHAAVHGFGASASVLEAIDARLPRALLRCAFTACILPNREWDLPEEEISARAEQRLQHAKATVDAEITWLGDGGPEPQWPAFPREQVHRRKHLRLPGGFVDDEEVPEDGALSSTEHVNHQAAALWLCQTRDLLDTTACGWLSGLTQAYMPWTIATNGAGIGAGEEVDHPPLEWNDAFFALVARCLVGLSFDEIDKLTLTPITTLPDRHFFDVLAGFLRNVDVAYFGGGDIPATVTVDVRIALANRLMVSRGWERLRRSKDMSIEMHIGPAIAVLFFNDHHFVQRTKCYLYTDGIERIDPFLPLLGRMVQSAPSPFVALVLLNLLEVVPRLEYLDVLVVAGRAWLDAYPDFRPFWIDHSIGRRWCMIVDCIRAQAPNAVDSGQQIRFDIDDIVAYLVGFGVPEASRLEKALSKH